jgi:hypothetical protein
MRIQLAVLSGALLGAIGCQAVSTPSAGDGDVQQPSDAQSSEVDAADTSNDESSTTVTGPGDTAVSDAWRTGDAQVLDRGAESVLDAFDAGNDTTDAALDTAVDDSEDRTVVTESDAVVDATAEEMAAAACQTIAEFCSIDGGLAEYRCVRDWSAAQNPKSWCDSSGGRNAVFIFENCGGHDIVVESATDTSVFYYYDTTSGQLIGVESHVQVAPRVRCVAGSPAGVELSGCEDGGPPSSLCASD